MFNNLIFGLVTFCAFGLIFIFTAIGGGMRYAKWFRDVALIRLRRIRLLASFIACVMVLFTLCVFIPTKVLADPPSSSYSPRYSFLMNNVLVVSNAAAVTTNIGNYTNIVLTSPSQHNMSVTTYITPTNAIGVTVTAVNFTNYFDLGQILATNGVKVTNWTADTPIVVTASTAQESNLTLEARIIAPTNFDNYDLIRLTKWGSNQTNSYTVSVVIGQ